MTGEDRYRQAVTKARLHAADEMTKYVNGVIDALPCDDIYERKFIIAEFDAMQAEIDRQHTILQAAGLDGARGEALLPTKQTVRGIF